MYLRTFGGLLILFIAFAIQFFLAGSGVFIDLTFAALITFAFLFDFWELMLMVVIATFLMNWKPTVSGEIVVFALYPIAAYFVRNFLTWQAGLKNALAIAVGFCLLYFVALHGLDLAHLPSLVADIFAGEIFGLFILLPLYRSREA